MSKTIKFNLVVDGKSIRTLTDLRDNFNIDDVYDLYEKGILKKWLDVRGYKKELEQLDQIISEESRDISRIIIKLIKVFAPMDENFNPKEVAYSQIFMVINEARIEEAKKNEFELKGIVEQYHFDYELLKVSIIENENSFDFIKSCIKEFSEKYIELFKLNYRQFFFEYVEKVPLAIFAVLMNEGLRELFLKDEFVSRELSTLYNDNRVLDKLGNNLKAFSGSTEGMWKYLGVSGKKYLVIRLSNGSCRVGEQCAPEVDLSANEINAKYEVLDGLLFKSTSESLGVFYLEV